MARLVLCVSALVALSAFLFAACGSDDDDDAATNTPAAAATNTTAAGGATATTGGSTGGEGDAAAGEAIYEEQCAVCHSIDGSESVGPTWQGMWGSEVELEDGTTVTVDEGYVKESIQDPTAQVHAGYEPVMPPLNLSDEDIANVIAFMQTLQ
jgi:cytochrome c oxidase subunit 2